MYSKLIRLAYPANNIRGTTSRYHSILQSSKTSFAGTISSSPSSVAQRTDISLLTSSSRSISSCDILSHSSQNNQSSKDSSSQNNNNNNNKTGFSISTLLLNAATGCIIGGLVYAKLRGYTFFSDDNTSSLFTVQAAKVFQPVNPDENLNRNERSTREDDQVFAKNKRNNRLIEDYQNNNRKDVISSQRPTFNSGGRGSKRQQFNFIADVVETASPAVVCIQVKEHSMIDWFDGVPRTANGGSGFIIQSDGLIVTNAHVINTRGRTSITVKLYDGRIYSGIVEAVDPESDLALIRINENNLPTLPLGSSADARIGEWVMAIGSPLSLTNSVSAGVVSSNKRAANEIGISNHIKYIQTDAAITFGNSGGPLVNLDGEAIGVNSMKVASGISFAIPSDHVKDFIAEAEKQKKAGRKSQPCRYMGLTLINLTEDLVDGFQGGGRSLDGATCGVMVSKVVLGSPAYLAGVQPGDIVEKINGKEVHSTKDIFDCLESSSTLTFLIRRQNKKYKTIVRAEDASY